MGLKISGVGAATNLDSSGEILDINGLDVTSLVLLNFEHESKVSSNYVGRVIFNKKIFSEQDCDSEDQLKYWNRTKLPFLYIIGELFDDVGHSGAMDVAAIAKYDARNADKYDYSRTFPLLGFSIEGSKINKDQNVITHSLARKCSITASPANKVCWGAIYEEPEKETIEEPTKTEKISRAKYLLNKMLKSEYTTDDEKILIKNDIDRLEEMSKSEDSSLEKVDFNGLSTRWNADNFKGYTARDHKNAQNAHFNAAGKTSDNKIKMLHMNMATRHGNMSEKLGRFSSQRAVSGIKKKEKTLEKNRGSLEFPGLPKVGTRQDQNIQNVDTSRQAEMFARKTANKVVRDIKNLPVKYDKYANIKQNLSSHIKQASSPEVARKTSDAAKLAGFNVPANTILSHGAVISNDNMSEGYVSGEGKIPTGVRREHEAIHHSLNLIGQKYGNELKDKVVSGMEKLIHPTVSNSLTSHLDRIGYSPDTWGQEKITHLYEMLHDPTTRELMRQTDPVFKDNERKIIGYAKKSWDAIRSYAKKVTPND